jgi:hypothetical protein
MRAASHLLFLFCTSVMASSLVAGCGSTGAGNFALSEKALKASEARLKIFREKNLLGVAAAARVKVDGREVANLGSGGTTMLDVPAGSHRIAVDHWNTRFYARRRHCCRAKQNERSKPTKAAQRACIAHTAMAVVPNGAIEAASAPSLSPPTNDRAITAARLVGCFCYACLRQPALGNAGQLFAATMRQPIIGGGPWVSARRQIGPVIARSQTGAKAWHQCHEDPR